MQYFYLASTYGCGPYNSSTYNGATSACTGSGSAGGSSAGGASGGGALTDTGIALVAAVTIACVIGLVATAIKIWKRPAKITGK